MSQFHFQRSSSDSRSGDRFFKISAANFPSLKALSLQDMIMEAGDIRHAHVHPNAYQIDYVVSGRGQVGIVGPNGERHVMELEEGDCAFIPRGYLHWIRNASEGTSRFLLVVSHESPETIELADMVTGTPTEVSGRTATESDADLERRSRAGSRAFGRNGDAPALVVPATRIAK
jgi:oxalate decarboxylase/phosphoglucose isomerase-like protein (cupin superfamily)